MWVFHVQPVGFVLPSLQPREQIAHPGMGLVCRDPVLEGSFHLGGGCLGGCLRDGSSTRFEKLSMSCATSSSSSTDACGPAST